MEYRISLDGVCKEKQEEFRQFIFSGESPPALERHSRECVPCREAMIREANKQSACLGFSSYTV